MENLQEKVKEFLKSNYSYCKDEHDIYQFDIYADYRDEMSNKDAIKILESNNPMDTFNDTLYDWYEESELQIKDDLMKEFKKYYKDKIEEDDDDILDWLSMFISINYPEDHFLNQAFNVNITLDTGDGNYDYALNTPHDEKFNDKASLVWLAIQQGYTKEQLEEAVCKKDTIESHNFLESVCNEVANEVSDMNTLTFLVSMTLKQLVNLNERIKKQEPDGHIYDATERCDCGTITLTKNTMTGLFNPWCGGGSVLEIQLEKDIEIPIKFIRSAMPDGYEHYDVGEVYGMCGSAWKNFIISIN